MLDSVTFRQLSALHEVCKLYPLGTCPHGSDFPMFYNDKRAVEKIKCNNCLLSFQWKTSITVNLPCFEILSSGKVVVMHQFALDELGIFLRSTQNERAPTKRERK